MLTDQTRGHLLKFSVIALLVSAVLGSLLIASGVTRLDFWRMALHEGRLPLSVGGLGVRVASPFAVDAPWGLQVGDYAILIHPDGYVSAGPGEPRWLEFPHVRRGVGSVNVLLLLADEDAMIVFVNDERVTRLPRLTDDLITGIDLPAEAVIRW